MVGLGCEEVRSEYCTLMNSCNHEHDGRLLTPSAPFVYSFSAWRSTRIAVAHWQRRGLTDGKEGRHGASDQEEERDPTDGGREAVGDPDEHGLRRCSVHPLESAACASHRSRSALFMEAACAPLRVRASVRRFKDRGGESQAPASRSDGREVDSSVQSSSPLKQVLCTRRHLQGTRRPPHLVCREPHPGRSHGAGAALEHHRASDHDLRSFRALCCRVSVPSALPWG